jgi:hypothetical protein
VIMFSAHAQATREAELQESARSRAAAFSAVLSKPFDLDELLEGVERSIGESRSAGKSLRGQTIDAARRPWAGQGIPNCQAD